MELEMGNKYALHTGADDTRTTEFSIVFKLILDHQLITIIAIDHII